MSQYRSTEDATAKFLKRNKACISNSILVTGALIATVFSILVVSHCNFVTTEDHVLGLYSSAQYDEDGDLIGCVTIYDERIEIDVFYTTARVFGTIGAIAVSMAFLLLLVIYGLQSSKFLWNISRSLMTAGAICSILIFTVLGSSYCTLDDCRLTGVGILNVFNLSLLTSIAATMFISKPPEEPIFVIWSTDMFVVNKDTLILQQGSSVPEFLGHEDTVRATDEGRHSGTESIDLCKMEVVDGKPCFAGGHEAVGSVEQSSIQDNLIINVQVSKRFRCMLLSMILLTWSLSIFSVRRCTFIMVSAKADSSQKFGMGIYTRAVYHESNMLGCLAYPPDPRVEFNGAFRSAQYFGTAATVLLSLVLICCFVQLFTTFARKGVWFAIRTMLWVALVFQSLIFLAFKSSVCQNTELIECGIGGAGMATVINCMLLLGLGCLSCAVPPPANPLVVRRRSHELELFVNNGVSNATGYQEQYNGSVCQEGADTQARQSPKEGHSINPPNTGQEFISVRMEFGPNETKTIKEITHPDGSKTVTTAIEKKDEENAEEDEFTVDSREAESTVDTQ